MLSKLSRSLPRALAALLVVTAARAEAPPDWPPAWPPEVEDAGFLDEDGGVAFRVAARLTGGPDDPRMELVEFLPVDPRGESEAAQVLARRVAAHGEMPVTLIGFGERDRRDPAGCPDGLRQVLATHEVVEVAGYWYVDTQTSDGQSMAELLARVGLPRHVLDSELYLEVAAVPGAGGPGWDHDDAVGAAQGCAGYGRWIFALRTIEAAYRQTPPPRS